MKYSTMDYKSFLIDFITIHPEKWEKYLISDGINIFGHKIEGDLSIDKIDQFPTRFMVSLLSENALVKANIQMNDAKFEFENIAYERIQFINQDLFSSAGELFTINVTRGFFTGNTANKSLTIALVYLFKDSITENFVFLIQNGMFKIFNKDNQPIQLSTGNHTVI